MEPEGGLPLQREDSPSARTPRVSQKEPAAAANDARATPSGFVVLPSWRSRTPVCKESTNPRSAWFAAFRPLSLHGSAVRSRANAGGAEVAREADSSSSGAAVFDTGAVKVPSPLPSVPPRPSCFQLASVAKRPHGERAHAVTRDVRRERIDTALEGRSRPTTVTMRNHSEHCFRSLSCRNAGGGERETPT